MKEKTSNSGMNITMKITGCFSLNTKLDTLHLAVLKMKDCGFQIKTKLQQKFISILMALNLKKLKIK